MSLMGPTPPYRRSGIAARKAVTLGGSARETGFEYEDIEFDAAFTVDIRGRSRMRGVEPYFLTVKVEASLCKQESQAQLTKFVEETEARCLALNLIKDAGIRIETGWIRDAGDAGLMVA